MLLALSGVTCAVSLIVLPTFTSFAPLICTPSTFTISFVIVTVQLAVNFSSSVFTVIVAVPSFIPFILPFSSTVTIFSSLDVHINFTCFAFSGNSDATRVAVPSGDKLKVVRFNSIPSISTFSSQLAFNVMSCFTGVSKLYNSSL